MEIYALIIVTTATQILSPFGIIQPSILLVFTSDYPNLISCI
jgi:hypothetical protein